MWVALENVRAKLSRATPAERDWIADHLSFDDVKARYSEAFKSGRWDGKVRLFDRRTDSFPAGLLGLVKRGAAARGFTVDVDDRRQRVEPVPATATTGWLDPAREQPQAVEACLAAGRGIVWMPTASGKTEVMAALGLRVPGNWLVLVHKRELLNQTAERFQKRTGEEAGRVGDGMWDARRFTVATFQTLHAALKVGNPRVLTLLAQADGVISDECHVLPAGTFSDVIARTVRAYWRFGFSGTPLARGDRRNILLAAATGDVVYRVRAQALVERGVLSRPKIRLLPMRQNVTGHTWQEVYERGIVGSLKRNASVAQVALVAEKPCLLFVREIEHGRNLMAMLRRLKVRADFVWGKHDTAKRRQATKELQRGDLDVLVVSTIFDEGLDIPEVRSVIVAAGGKSAIKALQRLGRGMRVMDDKSEVELWDFRDTGQRWLEEHAEDRIAVYTGEGFEVVDVQAADEKIRDLLAVG